MAGRRMFAKNIIDSDIFLDMSLSTQALYFHLAMRADDDGFINNPKRIQRMIGAGDDEMKILIAKQYIIPFESGVVVIRHWKIHNYIRSDRYTPTNCAEKNLVQVSSDNVYEPIETSGVPNVIPNDNQNGYHLDTQVRLGKVRSGKVRLGQVRSGKAKHSTSAEVRDKSKPDCSPELAEALKAFEEHRKKLKKPMTDYAKKLLLGKLSKLAKTEQEQIAILNQSIENGWQGVFPLGGDRGQRNQRQSASDMASDVIRMMDERGMLDDAGGKKDDDSNAGSVPSWFSEQ